MERVAAAVLLFLCSLVAQGAYPERPVRLIVPAAPGGAIDVVGRLVGGKLSDVLGQNVVIDNRAGANNIIGSEIAARSVPDGYTLLLVSLAHTVSAALNTKRTYEPLRDLIPVSLLVSVPNVLLVNRSVPVQSVPDLINLAKAKPGELNYASAHATSLHIAGELFKSMTGTDIVNVNYKSGVLGVPDLESGRVQMCFSVSTTAMSVLRNGRVRALAVTSAQRSAALPDLPALSEFIPGYEVVGWQGILAPAGTPRPIVEKLSAVLGRSMRTADVRAKLVSMGADPIGSTPEEFAAFRKSEFTRLSALVVKAGIKSDH